MSQSELLKQALAGKTLFRSQVNLLIQKHCHVYGVVLDLGCGKSPSYYRYWTLNSDFLVKVDLVSKNGTADVIADLESGLPFKRDCADCVILFNVLEHTFNYRLLLQEIHRVLKPYGKLFLAVPFLYPVHPDPYDYFRYTRSAMERLLSQTRYKVLNIETIGGILSSMANTVPAPRVIAPLLFFFAKEFDQLIEARFKGKNKDRYPIGYFVIALKMDSQNTKTKI